MTVFSPLSLSRFGAKQGGLASAASMQVMRSSRARAYQLSYAIPAEVLSQFWQSLVAKANQVHANPEPTRRAVEVLRGRPLFEGTKLAYIDPDNVDGRSCWIHVGARDYIANAASEKCDLDFDTKRYTYRSVLQDATQNR
ncbi:hypothetical protein PCL_07399 [Purpureocillium lilacinum]|uniref:Uncharacterized protein n=1 Tax=Purpureocillium lilacinum TaxID=33203 RepID=A0A2U3DS59_PURLI|nr:hypothetical protein PCL_07399 [Purpureocillium lilacinum]